MKLPRIVPIRRHFLNPVTPMPTSTLSKTGQATIPKRVREFLRLKPGDRLEFIIEESGQVLLRPVSVDLKELDGLLVRPDKQPVSVEAMHEAVREKVSEPYGGTS